MSELSPALISIAGGNEFLFARFYHIYEGVQLVLPESPPIVSGVSDMPRRIVQTWKRHGIRCKHSTGRNAHIFLQRIFHLHFPQKSAGCTSYHIPSHAKKGLSAQSGNPFSFRYMLRYARLIHTFHRSSALFYGNNLRQISWLIYIESLIGRHIVREQLQCHRCRQHHELILHIRQRENFVLLR